MLKKCPPRCKKCGEIGEPVDIVMCESDPEYYCPGCDALEEELLACDLEEALLADETEMLREEMKRLEWLEKYKKARYYQGKSDLDNQKISAKGEK